MQSSTFVFQNAPCPRQRCLHKVLEMCTNLLDRGRKSSKVLTGKDLFVFFVTMVFEGPTFELEAWSDTSKRVEIKRVFGCPTVPGRAYTSFTSACASSS